MKFNEITKILDEEIKPPKTNGIIVLDIDDTLITADPKVIKIYKSFKGGPETALNTAEFAKDPDKEKPGYKYDYRDFKNPEKVYESIVHGTPMLRNLKMMDAHIRAGYEVAFLTARGLQKVVASALSDFLLYKNKEGKLVKLPKNVFRTDLSAAVNDDDINYPGSTDAEKKANVLRKLCKKYGQVVFVDDDPRNIATTRKLAKTLPNLKVVQASKEPWNGR